MSLQDRPDAMLMDYWSPRRLNHHTEAATMLYAARECARVVIEESLDRGIARHQLTSSALRAGLEAMGLELFGDAKHRMSSVTGVCIPGGVKVGEQVRAAMLSDFGIEIGTSLGRCTAGSGASARWAMSAAGRTSCGA